MAKRISNVSHAAGSQPRTVLCGKPWDQVYSVAPSGGRVICRACRDAQVRRAAPDMLEALLEIREACCSGMGSLPADDIERAQQAIEKAGR